MEINKLTKLNELGTEEESDIPEVETQKKKSEPLSLGIGETKISLQSNGYSLELHSSQSPSMERTAEIGLRLMQNLKGNNNNPKKSEESYLG